MATPCRNSMRYAASTGDIVRAALRRWLAAEAEPTVESIDTLLFHDR